MTQYVQDGGTLFINAASRDDFSPFNLGFGVTLNSGASSTAAATGAASAVTYGPNGNAGTS
jgi:hypothetical protein